MSLIFNGNTPEHVKWGDIEIDKLVYNGNIVYQKQSPTSNNKIYYTSTDGNVVTPYDTSAFNANIVSNEYVDNQGVITFDDDVTKIGLRAFYNRSNLTSINIPNSVTEIGNYAFRNCTNLTSINIPNSVTIIGNHAFYNCSNLTSINIPNSVTEIGNNAFYNCSNLTSINIPNSVTIIGIYAFRGCLNLTSINIPNSVTEIGNNAFRNCQNLTSITVNATTPPTLGTSAFYDTNNCPIYVPASSVNTYKTASGWSEYADRILPIQQNDEIIYFSSSKLAETTDDYGSGLHINKFNTTISSHTFSDSVGVIKFNGDVTSIGNFAFMNTKNLTAIYIPNLVTSSGNSSFAGCSSLTSVIFGESFNYIGNYTFSLCTGLTSINITNSIINIGEYAFSNCSNLTSVTLGNSLEIISNYAFEGCSNLASIVIPNSVSHIGFRAFYDCYGLTSVKFSTNLSSIPSYSFYNCSGLTSLEIPANITNIGEFSFMHCSSLTKIEVLGTTPATLGTSAFNDTNNCPIYVPADKVDTYKAAWTNYASRIQGIEVTQPNNEIWYTSTDNQIVTPYNIGYFGASLLSNTYENGKGILKFDGNVTSIGYKSFDTCTTLKTLKMPSTVTNLGDSSFARCSGLTSIDITDSVTLINHNAFNSCSGLLTVNISSSVTTIGVGTFNNCTSLSYVTISATTPPSLDYLAFNNTNNCPIYVPADKVDTYKTASGWSTYADRIQSGPPILAT